MPSKIISFPAQTTPEQGIDAALERAIFLAEAEAAWTTATVPQAPVPQAQSVY